MTASAPHYLLFSASAPAAAPAEPGEWRFVLQSADGTAKLEIADAEPDVHGERLELLAVVRGLEALDQPSHVTLVTPSRYVSRGISYGLADWRDNGWQWERHGEMVPIKNHDLWQRIDRALEFHRIECRTESPTKPNVRQWRIDSAHEQPSLSANASADDDEPRIINRAARRLLQASVPTARGTSDACAAAPAPAGSAGLKFDSKVTAHRRPRIRLILLNCRRVLNLFVERLWHRLRVIGSPLFRAPWLD